MFYIILLIILISSILFSVYNIVMYVASSKWKPTKAVIQSMSIRLKRLMINFFYVIDGKICNQSKSFTFYSNIEAKSFAERRGLKEKDIFDIYYNPKRPHMIILGKGYSRLNKYSIRVTAFLMISILCFFFLRLFY